MKGEHRQKNWAAGETPIECSGTHLPLRIATEVPNMEEHAGTTLLRKAALAQIETIKRGKRETATSS